jgi:hypothetical protein
MARTLPERLRYLEPVRKQLAGWVLMRFMRKRIFLCFAGLFGNG